MEKLEDVGGFRLIASRISSNFSPNFRSSFVPWMCATSSGDLFKSLSIYRRISSRGEMKDGWIFLPSTPFLPSRGGMRRNICTLSFLPFPFFPPLFEICFLVFLLPPPLPLEVKLLGNWKMRDVEIFGGKLVHCFVTIRVVDPWRDKNNVFIWKNCLFEIIIIKD